MISSAFLDTNVLVYAFGKADPRKPVSDELLLLGGVLSVQVLNEFASVARKKLLMDWALVRRSIELATICCPNPRPLSHDTHAAAIGLCERFGFSIYDSMILASAIEAGCTTLYTEDLQHGQIIDGLRIENPFVQTTNSE